MRDGIWMKTAWSLSSRLWASHADITLHAKWQSAYTWEYTIRYVDEANEPIDGVEPTKGSASANTYITVVPKGH